MRKSWPRVVLGAVFAVSGLLKTVDPVGTALIFGEYLKFFAVPELGSLIPDLGRLVDPLDFSAAAGGLCLLGGMLLSLFETFLGILLLCGVMERLACALTGAVLSVFLGITTALVIKNPPMDCGCFGSLIHLSHTASFLKNLVLLAVWEVFRRRTGTCGNRPGRSLYASGLMLAVAAFCLVSLRNLPLIDSTSLKKGADIENLEVRDSFGQYSTLGNGPLVIVSCYSCAKDAPLEELSALRQACDSEGLELILLTCCGQNSCEFFFDGTFFIDRRTALSLNRCNWGACLIQDGKVAGKWKFLDFPAIQEAISRSLD